MWGVLIIILAAPCVGGAVRWVVAGIGMPAWSYYVVLFALSVACYLTNMLLIGYFIRRRAPEFASREVVSGNMQKWELTAGFGIVPKWVSLIGLMSVSCLLAMLVPVVALLFR